MSLAHDREMRKEVGHEIANLVRVIIRHGSQEELNAAGVQTVTRVIEAVERRCSGAVDASGDGSVC